MMTLFHLLFVVTVAIAQTSGSSDFKIQYVDQEPSRGNPTSITAPASIVSPTGVPQVLDSTPKPITTASPTTRPAEGNSTANPGNTTSPWSSSGEYLNGPSGSRGEYFGPGVMEKCGTPPASATTALKEAQAFRAGCSYAQRGESQKIAINDYSTRPAYMYIYDLNGTCLGKTMVAFGNGQGGEQVACSDHGSHLSPPGFHLTAVHNNGGGIYDSYNSLKMVGLQGQNSTGRGILLHACRAPGTSSTWGCAGVGYDAFKAVQKTLGYGALVYNYWKRDQLSGRCKTSAGMSKSSDCRPDRDSPGIPGNATGQGSPAVALLNLKIFAESHANSFPSQRLRIKKGTEILINRKLESSGTYEIVIPKEEAVGPNVATPEALAKALGYDESLSEFKKRLSRDSGAIYILKADLPLLWEEEIFRLQKYNGRDN